MEFTNFTDEDFNAYVESKWASNVFTLERLQVKQKLTALGHKLASDLTNSDGSFLAQEVSVEHPAIWNQHQVKEQTLFFYRDDKARQNLEAIMSKGRSIASLINDPSPFHNHVFLFVTVNSEKLEIGLRLYANASVDRENAQKKCQDFFQREKLLNLIRKLPNGFCIGLTNTNDTSASDLTDEQLQKLVSELQDSKTWLSIYFPIDRNNPSIKDGTIVELARSYFSLLLPILHYISWSRENDFLSMRETLQEKETRLQTKGLEKSDPIRVVRGVFKGKTGIVQEVGAKGGIKVLIGNMVVKLTGDDLAKN